MSHYTLSEIVLRRHIVTVEMLPETHDIGVAEIGDAMSAIWSIREEMCERGLVPSDPRFRIVNADSVQFYIEFEEYS